MSNPRQRVHRILRAMQSYDSSEEIKNRAPAPVRDQGGIIGVYGLTSQDPKTCIWITEHGIWAVQGDHWEYIDYARIQDLKYPDPRNESDKMLVIDLGEGLTRSLFITGAKGRIRDAFEFGRFLERSKADAASNDPDF